MSNRSAVFMAAVLFFFALTSAVRPDFSLAKTRKEGVEEEDAEIGAISCKGMDEKECLAKRGLEAHTDYIYTEGQAHFDYIYTKSTAPPAQH